MKKRIDLRPFLTDPLHGARILLYIVLVIAVAVPVQHAIMVRSSAGWWYATVNTILPPLHPPLVAAGEEVLDAVHRYQGIGDHGVWRAGVTSALTSLILGYLVGPSLFVWGLRARMRARQLSAGPLRTTVIALALAFGGASVVALVPTALMAYEFQRSHDALVDASTRSEACSRMSDELFTMANRAQVAYFVPEGSGQSAGSWVSNDGSGRPLLSITRLIPPGTKAVMADARHAVVGNVSFELVIEGPDSLTIRGIDPIAYEGEAVQEDSVDAAGRGLLLGVTPDRVTMIRWR